MSKSAWPQTRKSMEEERHYEISRIAKETATLKGRNSSAIEEFETLLLSFVNNQTTHFQQFLDSISQLLDFMAMKHE